MKRLPNIIYVVFFGFFWFFFCFPVLKRINIPNLALKTGDRIMDDGVVDLVFMLAELPHVPHLPWLAPLTHVVFYSIQINIIQINDVGADTHTGVSPRRKTQAYCQEGRVMLARSKR